MLSLYFVLVFHLGPIRVDLNDMVENIALAWIETLPFLPPTQNLELPPLNLSSFLLE